MIESDERLARRVEELDVDVGAIHAIVRDRARRRHHNAGHVRAGSNGSDERAERSGAVPRRVGGGDLGVDVARGRPEDGCVSSHSLAPL